MKASCVVALVLLLAVSTLGARNYPKEFTQFMNKYSKSYAHEDFRTRFVNFKNNLDLIDAHNALGKSYTLRMNQFGDLSREEFKSIYLGYKRPTLRFVRATAPANLNIAASVDWTTQGAVTPVKNQGQCGSCWAFSTTGSLEGLYAISQHQDVSSSDGFSEQQLVDCSQSYGNDGCDGGLMDYAFKYVAANGIASEDAYPYTAEDGTCSYVASEKVFANSAYTDVATNDEDALTAAIAQQPVSVAIEADQDSFQFYSGGVFDDTSCGTQLDHGVLAVGYGTDSSSNQPFYKVKNSWGADWGENGYIRMLRGTGSGNPGICGIAMAASYPTA